MGDSEKDRKQGGQGGQKDRGQQGGGQQGGGQQGGQQGGHL